MDIYEICIVYGCLALFGVTTVGQFIALVQLYLDLRKEEQ